MINDTLKECRGLLFAFDSLYVQTPITQRVFIACATPMAMTRFDEVTRACGNFPAASATGETIWPWVRTTRFTRFTATRSHVPTRYDRPHIAVSGKPSRQEDRRRPRGSPRIGDGKTWELLTAGLRNPYGIDFNARTDKLLLTMPTPSTIWGHPGIGQRR